MKKYMWDDGVKRSKIRERSKRLLSDTIHFEINAVTVRNERFSIKDLAAFHVQRRGFPSILKLGPHYGEGQTGGAFITQLAHEVEDAFVAKYGADKYQIKMSDAVHAIDVIEENKRVKREDKYVERKRYMILTDRSRRKRLGA